MPKEIPGVRSNTAFTIEAEKEAYFFEAGVLAVALSWVNFGIIAKIPPRTKIKVNRYSGDVGLTDDPTDESIWFSLVFGSLAATSDPRSRAIWNNNQRWRSLGTPAQVLDVTEHVEVDFEADEPQFNDPIRGEGVVEPNETAIKMMATSTTTSSLHADGVVGWTEFIEVRRFHDGPQGWPESPEEIEVNSDLINTYNFTGGH